MILDHAYINYKTTIIILAAVYIYSKNPRSVTAFDLFTFFLAYLIQSEANWNLSSTSDWLMSTRENVN